MLAPVDRALLTLSSKSTSSDVCQSGAQFRSFEQQYTPSARQCNHARFKWGNWGTKGADSSCRPPLPLETLRSQCCSLTIDASGPSEIVHCWSKSIHEALCQYIYPHRCYEEPYRPHTDLDKGEGAGQMLGFNNLSNVLIACIKRNVGTNFCLETRLSAAINSFFCKPCHLSHRFP